MLAFIIEGHIEVIYLRSHANLGYKGMLQHLIRLPYMFWAPESWNSFVYTPFYVVLHHGYSMCVCAVAVLCLFKVSSSSGSRPGHGSSAEFAESTANVMSRSNKNWCCMSPVCVFTAYLLTIRAHTTQLLHMLTASLENSLRCHSVSF